MTYSVGALRDVPAFNRPNLRQSSSQRIVFHALGICFAALATTWVIGALDRTVPEQTRIAAKSTVETGGSGANRNTDARESDPIFADPGAVSAFTLDAVSPLPVAAFRPLGAVSKPANAKPKSADVASKSVDVSPRLAAVIPEPPDSKSKPAASTSKPVELASQPGEVPPSYPIPVPRPADLFPQPRDVTELASNVPLPPMRPTFPASPAPAKPSAPRSIASRTAPEAITANLAAATPDRRTFFQKLFGQPSQSAGPVLAYARADDGETTIPQSPRISAALPASGGRTAIYDIAAHTVYLPNGERLEAHSGLGDRIDDPYSVSLKNRGATPPHVYNLELREQLFHGVRALRLNPVGGGNMFGRTGLLAHTFMLGASGQSNGCVSFRDYSKFLDAYLKGDVTRLVVVPHLG
jgi:hypothetical protein